MNRTVTKGSTVTCSTVADSETVTVSEPGQLQKTFAELREAARSTLHRRIDAFELSDSTDIGTSEFSFHRSVPIKNPTVVLTGACDNVAGRNSINRYLAATGFTALTKVRQEMPDMIRISPTDTLSLEEMMINGPLSNVVSLPVKIPGKASELSYVDVTVLDGPLDRHRNLPIKLNQRVCPEGCGGVMIGEGYISSKTSLRFNSTSTTNQSESKLQVLLPSVDVPKCGAAFDFFPYPSDHWDEGLTQIYGKTNLPEMGDLVSFLDAGIVKITLVSVEEESDSELVKDFDKFDTNTVTKFLYCTTKESFVRPLDSSETGTSTSSTSLKNFRSSLSLSVFDVEEQGWTNVDSKSIREVRVKSVLSSGFI